MTEETTMEKCKDARPKQNNVLMHQGQLTCHSTTFQTIFKLYPSKFHERNLGLT